MKTLFYYNIEPFKGYISNDKKTVNEQPFETGYWNEIIGEDIEKEWQAVRMSHNKSGLDDLFSKINKKIKNHKVHIRRKNKKVKNVYLNFNFDGIDCFISRWNR